MLTRRLVGTGIDLGRHAVKLVRVESEGGSPRVTHWGIEEVQPADRETLAGRSRALARLLSRLGLNTPRRLGRVATAVNGRDVYVRQVTMPVLSADDLRRSLPYEAKKHLPLKNVPDPFLDFQVLAGVPAPDGAQAAPTQEVLLVAVPRESRDEALRILDQSGIDPHVVDVEPLPSVNAVLASHPAESGQDGTVLVLDLGEESTELAAVYPDGGLYVRALSFTGKDVTERVMGELSCDRQTAETRLRDLAQDAGLQKALEEPLAGLLREIGDTLRHLSSRQRSRRLARVHLFGGLALLAGLSDRLSSALGVPVTHPDPLASMIVPADGVPDPEDRVRLVTSAGLARWWEPGEV